MSHFVDTCVLLGWILEDDEYEEASSRFFSGFRYGELDIVPYVLFDLHALLLKEVNYTMTELLKAHPVLELERMAASDLTGATELVVRSIDDIAKKSRYKHRSLKGYIEEVVCERLKEGRVLSAAKDLPIEIPHRLLDRIIGCLGQDSLQILMKVDSSKDAIGIQARAKKLALDKSVVYGEQDSRDRKILYELLMASSIEDVTFSTFDESFFKGYRQLCKREMSANDPRRRLRFRYIVTDSKKKVVDTVECMPS